MKNIVIIKVLILLIIMCLPIAAQQPQIITGRVVGISDFAREQNQQTQRQVSDLIRKIYVDGDLPKEWDNLSDKEVELEIYKLTSRDGKPPEGWENWSKLVTPERLKIKRQNIGIGCYVECMPSATRLDAPHSCTESRCPR